MAVAFCATAALGDVSESAQQPIGQQLELTETNQVVAATLADKNALLKTYQLTVKKPGMVELAVHFTKGEAEVSVSKVGEQGAPRRFEQKYASAVCGSSVIARWVSEAGESYHINFTLPEEDFDGDSLLLLSVHEIDQKSPVVSAEKMVVLRNGSNFDSSADDDATEDEAMDLSWIWPVLIVIVIVGGGVGLWHLYDKSGLIGKKRITRHPAIVPTAERAQIVLFISGHKKMYLNLKALHQSEPLVIGRSPECHIAVSDSGVSSRHLRLLIHHSKLSLVDTNSKNGTWVNGRRIASQVPVTLHEGDIILIHKIQIRVERI